MVKFFSLIFGMIVLITSCSNDNSTEPIQKIKVAAILDLSGHYSQFGIESQQAMDLAKSNEKLIEFTYYDSKGLSNVADSLLNHIISKNDTKIIVSLASWISNALAQKVKENGMLQITIGSAAFSGSSLKSSIKLTEGVESESEYLIEQLKKYDKIAIMYFNNDYGISWNMALQNALADKIVATEQYLDTQEDYTNELNRIMKQNPDIIVLISTREAAIITKQAKSLGINTQMIGTRPILTNDLLNEPSSEGLIFSYPKLNLSLPFFTEFYNKNGYHGGAFAAEGYDLTKIISNGLKNNKTNPTDIFNWLSESTIQGALGTIQFNNLCEADYPFTLMIVKNGNFEELK